MSALVGAAFPWAAVAVFATAAIRDLTRRRIDNALVGAVLLAWAAAVATGGGVPQGATVTGHLLAAAAGFALLFPLYLLGSMGGGDVKMAAAVLLWAGPDRALPTIALIGLAGMGLAVLMLLLHPLVARYPDAVPLSLLDKRRGVPYGVALSIGGAYAAIAWVLPPPGT